MAITPEQSAHLLRTSGIDVQAPSDGVSPQQSLQMLQAAGVSPTAPAPGVAAPTGVAPQYDEWQSLGHGLMRGAKDLGQGLEEARLSIGEKHPYMRDIMMANPMLAPIASIIPNQPAGTTAAYRKQVNREISDYEKRTSAHPFLSGGARLAGNIVAGAPLGGVEDIAAIGARPIISKVLGGALSGGLYGGLSFDPTGEGRPLRAALGAGLGGVLAGTFHGAKTLFKWLKSKPTLIDDPAVLHKAAERVQEAQDIGIPQITAGTASGDPVIQAREQALLKSGTSAGKMLQNAHKQISQQIHDVGNDMVDQLGGKVMTQKIMGGELQDAAQATQRNARSNISKMYEMAEKAPGGNAPLNRTEILHTAGELLDNTADLKFSPAIQKTLGKISKAGKNVFITPTKQSQSFESPFTILEANKFIKTINKAVRGTSDYSQRFALSQLKSSVMNSIDELADDPDNPSRSLFNMARHIRRKLADVYDQKDIVGTIEKMKGTSTHAINPEDVMGRIFGRRNKITDIEKVEKALKYEMPFNDFAKEVRRVNPAADLSEIQEEYTNKILPQQERNKQLWDDLRTTKFHDLLDKSIQTINETPSLSYKLLVKNIKQLGKESLDKILGNKEVSDKFYKLINVMDHFENQAPTKVVADKAIKSIQRLSGGIFGSIGGEESRLGAFAHKPLGMLINVLKNINDANWVRANLHLGSTGRTHLDEAIDEDPEVVNKMQQFIKNNPHIREVLGRGAALAPIAQFEQPEAR